MKKIVLTILIFLFILLPLSSIGFGYHVFEVRTSPNFSLNGWQFPTSVLYQFNFPMPDFVPGSATSFAFRLDNGIDYRTLRQDPLTGEILAADDSRYPARDYMTLYDEFNFIFSQGFLHTDFADDDFLRINLLVGGRFEDSFEGLEYFSNSEHTEGVFHTMENGKIADRSPFGADFLPGTPELSGGRSVFELSLSAGLDLDFMKDDITSKNGVKFSSWIRYSPDWLNFFTDTSDFFIWRNKLDVAWTLFRLPFVKDYSSLSMVLSNSTEYRYLMGGKIPYYIQGGKIWETEAAPTEHVVTSSTALTLYGPQLFVPDVYPYVSAFIDVGYGWGRVLNSDVVMKGDFVISYGVKAELILFNVARVYYDIGVVSDDNSSDVRFIQRFGFAVGI